MENRDIEENNLMYEALVLSVLFVGTGIVVALEWLSTTLGRNGWILRWLLVLSVCGLIAYIAMTPHGDVLHDSHDNPIQWRR